MSFFTSAVRLESTQQHPSALDEPYDRLARTAQVLSTIGFGSKRDADRVTARVRALHRSVRGALPEPSARTPPAPAIAPTTRSC